MRRVSGALVMVMAALWLAVAPAAAHGRTVVVFVGGIDSELQNPNWDELQWQLSTGYGFDSRDFFRYSYRGWRAPAGGATIVTPAYGLADTCQPIAESSRLLNSLLRYLRDGSGAEHAVLVGHSLGGVVALNSVLSEPDLTPFVRTTVAADSPILGVSAWRSLWAGLAWGPCQAVDELEARYNRAAEWDPWLRFQAASLMARDGRLLLVQNVADDVVPAASQCLCGMPIHLEVDLPDGHSAVWYDVPTVARIAATIGAQGE